MARAILFSGLWSLVWRAGVPTRAMLMVLALPLAGCRGQTSSDPPIVALRDMFNQDRYNPQAESQLFGDGRTMRTPVQGTIPREREIDPEIGQGRLPDDSGYVAEVPQAIAQRFGGARAMLERGLERYDIYCRACHDGTGAGRGAVITRSAWQPPPPSFQQDRIRHMPDGQLFATISHGVRAMPSYGAQIPVNDRWAIVSYVRALELSQGE
jgi:mono/diheme cytochrome c family protein